MKLGLLRLLSFSCCTMRARRCSRFDPSCMSCRLLPLVPPGVFYDVRIFADTWNAPISEVGAAVLRVATDLGAFAIVVAANDQVCNSRGCSAIGNLALNRSACRGLCLGPQGRGVHISIQVIKFILSARCVVLLS